MPFNTLSFAIVIGALLIAGAPMAVNAHSRFGCPSPRSNDFGEKSGPCGGLGRAGHPYTTFSPGLNTLVIAEAIFHGGSPWSIQLALGSDSQVYNLLDHIPQNSVSQSPSYANPHVFTINVDIPNINCTDCALIMYNPMVSRSSSCTRTNDQCSAYHSCANIKIAGEQNPTSWAASYTYAPSGWTYTTREVGVYTYEADSYVGTFPSGQSNKTMLGVCNSFAPTTIPSYNGQEPVPLAPQAPVAPVAPTPSDNAYHISYGVLSYFALLFTFLLAAI